MQEARSSYACSADVPHHCNRYDPFTDNKKGEGQGERKNMDKEALAQHRRNKRPGRTNNPAFARVTYYLAPEVRDAAEIAAIRSHKTASEWVEDLLKAELKLAPQ